MGTFYLTLTDPPSQSDALTVSRAAYTTSDSPVEPGRTLLPLRPGPPTDTKPGTADLGIDEKVPVEQPPGLSPVYRHDFQFETLKPASRSLLIF